MVEYVLGGIVGGFGGRIGQFGIDDRFRFFIRLNALIIKIDLFPQGACNRSLIVGIVPLLIMIAIN